MAAGRRPPRHNRLTRRRDAEKTRQSNPPPTGDPQKTDPICANRARDALVLTTVTAQSLSGRERPSPSYEKSGLASARPQTFVFVGVSGCVCCQRRAVCNAILIHLAIARADPPRRAQSPNERSTRDQRACERLSKARIRSA
jgi:hypothetical protein